MLFNDSEAIETTSPELYVLLPIRTAIGKSLLMYQRLYSSFKNNLFIV